MEKLSFRSTLAMCSHVVVLGVRIQFRISCIFFGFAVGLIPRILDSAWWSLESWIQIGAISVLLLFFHELGHAIAARLCSLKVYGIIVSGLGGACFTAPPKINSHKIMYLSGGLALQLIIFVLVQYFSFTGISGHQNWESVYFVLTYVNLTYALINALPIINTDGKKIFDILREILFGKT